MEEDEELQRTVESLLGAGATVVDCERRTSVREEETLLVNGVRVELGGADGAALREALLAGAAPPADVLARLLGRAGLRRAPVRMRTSLSVASSVVSAESVVVRREGRVVDERSKQRHEDNYYASDTDEVWLPRPPAPPLGAVTEEQEDELVRLAERLERAAVSAESSGILRMQTPTIFGTVASDQTPKDGSSRKSLPQTPQSSKGFGALLNGGGGAAAVTATENSGSSLESMHDTAIDADNSLVYRDGGNLVSGSLEALVQHMVPTADYYPDRAYLFAFLLSARLFIKPHTLLGQVCTLCDAQQHLGDKAPKERLGRFVPHLVQLLAEWTETFPYDFRDERVMGHVRSLTQKCVAIDPSVRREVSALLQALLLRLTALEKYEEFLQKVNAESSARSLDCLSSTDVTELCLNPASLAQQLTHIELERLSYIGPEEFVQAFAKENPNVETSFKDMKKTRNLESYVQWFNRLSYLVATEVCKHVKKKQRVKVMEYWIETARECFNIGNFNSLMAIIAGLNMSPISRLKKTWSKVPSAKFSILEHQMDPSSNFSSYRSTLKAAMWRSAGATDERQRIVIPFFSLLVKDLYFLNEGCSNKLPNGHINFEKFWQLAKQVTEFITWKQVTCPFEKNPKVITFLQASPVLTENALAIASFECEPPDNNHEKERYKTLRAELNS
ncbi:ras-GEF domain-containing family member 1B-like isoform X2 [Ischnura elegans]|uniref:ras-GEF domain-containing family member 1B-like isoform X2 n=1 Tax=Ischnura elegans TaxID=197161 RepID=UPI001ED87BC2|nr:ras-GEF domain-containing family member 1B-like isoform X2 [Ischnura elegans]